MTGIVVVVITIVSTEHLVTETGELAPVLVVVAEEGGDVGPGELGLHQPRHLRVCGRLPSQLDVRPHRTYRDLAEALLVPPDGGLQERHLGSEHGQVLLTFASALELPQLLSEKPLPVLFITKLFPDGSLLLLILH